MAIYVGQVGLVFQRTIKDPNGQVVNLQAYSTLELLFRDPDGVDRVKPAAFSTDGTDGRLQYTTVDGDLDRAGTWRIQAHVASATEDHYTEVGTFRVEANLSG